MDMNWWSKWAAILCAIHCASLWILPLLGFGTAVVNGHDHEAHLHHDHFILSTVVEWVLLFIVLVGLVAMVVRATRQADRSVAFVGVVLIAVTLVAGWWAHEFQFIAMIAIAPYMYWGGGRLCNQEGHSH